MLVPGHRKNHVSPHPVGGRVKPGHDEIWLGQQCPGRCVDIVALRKRAGARVLSIIVQAWDYLRRRGRVKAHTLSTREDHRN